MNLKDYLAIAGEHGLFRYVAEGRNAIIVEHLETGKRSSAHSSAKVNSLEDISIFTDNEDIPLGKVFDIIYEKENGGPAPDPKSDGNMLKSYFGGILPEYDKERVYTSDIKKIMQWYNILHKLNLLVKEEPEAKEKEEKKSEPEPIPAPVSKTKKPAGTKPVLKGKPDSRSAAKKSRGAPKAK